MALNQHDDDSDDSLPAMSQFFTVHDPSKAISPGDIVWAKFKKLYWPALVRTVYNKQKKISIWYADDPGKTFKVPVKNVCSFFDTEMTSKIVEDVKKAGCVQEHEGLTSHAKLFLKRRAEGRKDDPAKFFDQTYPFFLVEELLKKDPEADIANLKIPPLYIDHGLKVTRKTLKYADEESGDSEVCTDDEVSDEACNVEPDYLKKINLQVRENSNISVNDYTDKIVQFILSGKADLHLKKVLSKTVASDYRGIYERSIRRGKIDITNITFAGPIEDNEELAKLLSYLLLFSDKLIANKSPTKRKNRKGVAPPNYLASDKKAQFIYSVWLPESIIFAISKIQRVSLPKARLLFKENPESERQIFENIFRTLEPRTQETKCDSESMECRNETRDIVENGSDVPISPLKKLCVSRIKARDMTVTHNTPTVEEIGSDKISEAS